MLLVTGATGFVGQAVMKRLLSIRDDVRLLCRDVKKAKEIYPALEVVRGDITKKETLKNACKDVDTLLHIAGIVSYSKARNVLMSINYEGTKNLIESCKKLERIIFSSSVSVYGEIKGICDENYPRNPMNAYGESKMLAENAIMNSGVDYTILRIAPIYGKGSPSWKKNLLLMERGFPIPKTDKYTHIVHISDVANAFYLSLKKKRNGVYNIADKKPIRFVELSKIILSELGVPVKFMPYWLVSMIARLKGMKTYLDVLTIIRNYSIKKAESELGYRPKMNLLQGVKEMVKWYKKEKEM